jgi:hypothetical protein
MGRVTTPRNNMVIRSQKYLVQIRTTVIIKSMANHQICQRPQVTAKITKIEEIKDFKTEFTIILEAQKCHKKGPTYIGPSFLLM